MSNMFNKAKTTEKKAPAGKKSKGREVVMKNLNTLASIRSVMASLESLAQTTEATVKEQMANEFVKEGCAIGRKPESFKGIDEGASASCQLRKRSSRSVLTEGEIDLLGQHGVEYETLEDIPETYIINPAYAGDSDLLGKVSKKLEGIKGLPEDFIQHQESKSRHVASEESINKIFTLDPEVTAELLDVVATLAIRPKLETEDVKGAFKRIMKTL